MTSEPRLVLVLLGAPCAVVAQATATGVLEGTVKDASGAVLPGAILTASGPATRSERSDSQGGFRIAGLR